MKKYSLKITRNDFDELRRLILADMPEEAGAFALAGISEHGDQVDVLVRRPLSMPKHMMLVQNEYHLEVAPQAINGLVSLCESNGLGAVICHSHPSGLHYSPSDDYGEGRIAGTLRQFIPANAPIASLLFTPDEVTGRIWLNRNLYPVPLDEIIIVGSTIQRIEAKKSGSTKAQNLELYDRQVRAFGLEGQKAISRVKVGIIGVGGTGSPIAEQLARLGVSDFVLVDPDKFSSTNLTRVYGTFFGSTKKVKSGNEHKVNLIASHLKKINPKIQVRAINQSVVLSKVAPELLDRDILFLCTDEHWGRSIVNQIAYQYLIPAINLGVRITSDEGKISHTIGVIDVLHPDKACLWCKQFLHSERIRAESMSPRERQKLQRDGYVEDIDTPTPSVISFTSSVSSQAVSLFIHMFTNFMGESGDIGGLRYDFLTGETRRGTTLIDTNCICRKVKSFGGLKLLPTVKKLTYK
jgi:hypothetical protein